MWRHFERTYFMLDRYDNLIIEQLSLDARQSVSSIAEQVNLSRTAVSERIRKMEAQGTIKGYQVLLSESQKQEVSAFLEVKHIYARCSEVAHVFKAIPEVKTCHGISGQGYDRNPTILVFEWSVTNGFCGLITVELWH